MKKFFGDPLFIKEARQSKAPGHSVIVELLIFAAVFTIMFVVENIASVFAYLGIIVVEILRTDAAEIDLILSDTAVPGPMIVFSLFVTVFSIVISVIYCRHIEERKLSSMGFRRHGFLTEYLIGGALGISAITAATAAAAAAGTYSIRPGNPDPFLIIVCLLGFMIQGMSEEVAVRGYLMTSMARKNGVIISVIMSSMVFSAIHFANPGLSPIALINLFLFGAAAAVLFIKRGNIWAAAGMHTFWNFYQGNIYGINVSGTGLVSGTLMDTTCSGSLPAYLTGGAFGIEGSIYVTASMLLLILAVIFIVPVKKAEQAAEKTPETAFTEIKRENSAF